MASILISHLHDFKPVIRRFPAEKRAEQWRLDHESDQLRSRTLRFMGKTVSAIDAWRQSNCGVCFKSWEAWMSGNAKMPGKYHMALNGFLSGMGF